MKWAPRVVAVCAMIAFAVSPILAGTTGKIAGRVIDQETGAPLPGAQVVVEGTSLGALADGSGLYVILQVPPGKHRVKASMMGYTGMVQKDVLVITDLTVEVSYALAPTVLDVGAVVEVEAERPIVQKDVTDSRRIITSERLENMPVDGYEDILEAETSIVLEGGELHVRGGRGGEVVYMIDGMVVMDPLYRGSSAVKVARNAIEEMAVLTGGFNAEYGNAQSGIVNLVTREGSVSRTSGSVLYKTDMLSVDGTDIIPRNESFRSQQAQFSIGGPEPFTTYLLPAIGINLPGEGLSYFASFDGDITDTYLPTGRTRPDKELADLWDLSYPDRQDNEYSMTGKLTYRVSPNHKLTLGHRASLRTWDTFSWNFRHTPETAYRSERRTAHTNLSWTHTLSPKTFYTVNLSHLYTFRELLPGGHKPDWFPELYSPVGDYWGNNGWGFDSWGDFWRYLDDTIIHMWIWDGDRSEPFCDGEPFSDYGLDGIPLTGDAGENNGEYDATAGASEPFEDLNGNGRYDSALENFHYDYPEAFQDLNGNGICDIEPFYDWGLDGVENTGDYGEGNGRYDRFTATQHEPFDDLNGNGRRDNTEPFIDGVSFVDTDKDGEYDSGEVAYIDYNMNGVYDKWIRELHDYNHNGVWDPGENDLLVDYYVQSEDLNRVWDPGEAFHDWDGNGRWNRQDGFLDGPVPAEVFHDVGYDGMPNTGDYGEDDGVYNGPEWTIYDDENFNGTADEDEWVDYDGDDVVDVGEPFEDTNWDGEWDSARVGTFDQWAHWHEREEHIWTLKADVTSQVSRYHQVKSGAEISYQEFEQGDLQYPHMFFPDNTDDNSPIGPGGEPIGDDDGPYGNRGVFRDFFFRSPTTGAFYAQDKMEFEGLIVNAGLRVDFRYVGEQVGERTTVDALGREIPVEDWSWYISPRLGISHPITDHDVLYFNYGHFVQWPEFSVMYQRDTQGPSAFELRGNPNLEPEKTVAYELGIDHAFTDDFKVDITGFFKDIEGLLDQWHVGQKPWDYYMYANLDYGRSRGFELNFEKRYSNHISGTAGYTYMYATGKSSSDRQTYDRDFSGLTTPLRENYLDWDERHRVTVNFDYRILRGDEVRLFGLRVPDDWGVNVLWKYGSGLPFTKRDEDGNLIGSENIENNGRKPWTSTVDIKLSKGFAAWGMNYDVLLEALNLFDRENVRDIHANGVLQADGSLAWTPEGDGREISRNPTYYGPGRNIRVGIEMTW